MDSYFDKIDKDNIPQHIALIMDGNGRWAKNQGKPRTYGHVEGEKTLRKISLYCDKIGVKYLTAYAFSTENWKRPEAEVYALMKLFNSYIDEMLSDYNENLVVRFIGERSRLGKTLQKKMKEVEEMTKNNNGTVVTLAINYGGRDEISRAVKQISEDVKNNKIKSEDITENLINSYLDTSYMPDPDLVIRPSGELRISNYLLWQIAYSEFWYSDILWPDFSEEDLNKAIYDYQLRNRRFGGV